MNFERPREVKATHLDREAIVYMRQSTDEQVRNNTGSTEYQRGQARFPEQWGWPKDRITIVDCDLGLSGRGTAHRPGYLRMLDQIESGEVGALFVAELSRLGRKSADLYRLLDQCAIYDVLVVIDGRPQDLNDIDSLLMTKVTSLFSEHDNDVRIRNFYRGRLAKAHAGHAVSNPPAGYVFYRDRSWLKGERAWVKDPDPAIRGTVEKILREFLRQRSCKKTLEALAQDGVRLPRRFGAHIQWSPLQTPTILRILQNPAYKGDYVFGRMKSDPRRGRDRRGRLRASKASADNVIVTRNHHEPYVSAEEWDQIQEIIKLNAPSRERRNPGPGSAVLQGMIRCGTHRGRLMAAVYKPPRRDGARCHGYVCQGFYALPGGDQCGRIVGGPIDRAIVEAVINRLSAPRLAAIQEFVRELGADGVAEKERRHLQLEVARREAAALEKRFLLVDPENRLVAMDLEKRLEAAKREVAEQERRADKDESLTIEQMPGLVSEIKEVCRDLRALWAAPTTTNLERKQIVRSLIRFVVLEEKRPDLLRLRLTWVDETEEWIEVPLSPGRNALILAMSDDGLAAEEIMEELNRRGVLNAKGGPWKLPAFNKKVRALLAKRAASNPRGIQQTRDEGQVA